MTNVRPGYAADAAGLRDDDLILEINGRTLQDKADLLRRLWRTKPGDKMHLKIRRDGKELELMATLEKNPRDK